MTDYTDLKRRLAEPIIGQAHEDRRITSGPLAERLICERMDAFAAIAELETELARLQELLDLGPLGRLGLTLRTRKALRIAGITTLDKLRQTDEATLLRIPNLGRKGLNDIRAALTAS